MWLIQRFWYLVKRWRSDIDVVVPMMSTITTGVLTAWVMSRHVIVNYDSIFYLSIAENFSNGLGLKDYLGNEHANFPPGYPLLISFVMLFGADTVVAARFLEVVAAMAIVVLTAVIAHRFGPRGSAAIASLLAATIPAFLAMNVQIMSESLFAVAFLVVVLGLVRLPDPPQRLTVRHFLTLTVASWVCCFLRYQGYAVVVATALILLLRESPKRERFRAAAIYSVGAGVAIAANVAQSAIRTGALGAPVSDPRESLLVDVRTAFSFAGRWVRYAPSWLSSISAEVGGFVTVCLAVIAIFWILRRSKSAALKRTGLQFSIYAAVIIGVTLISARRVWVEITPRMAFALLPLLVILLAVIAAQNLSHTKITARMASAAFLALMLVVGSIQTLSQASRIREATRGIASQEQQAPELGGLVAELPDDEIVYSNNPEGVWYSSRRLIQRLDLQTVAVLQLTDPAWVAQQAPSSISGLQAYQERLCNGFYLAWTDWQDKRRSTNTIKILDVISDITLIDTVEGGTLYFVQGSDVRLCPEYSQVNP